MSSGRLSGRIALITGASRGIGAAVARRFAAEGAQLILVARTVGGLEETDDAVRAAGGTATLAPLDLKDYDKIDQMGAALAERFGRLDILVGNAGLLGALTPMTHIAPKMWDEVMAVNLTSNWRLLRSFDPLLRQSETGRAIFVTSTVGHQARAYWSAYAVSKAALEMMVKTYAAEITKTGVRANLINPGGTRTNMRATAFPGEDPLSLPAADDITEVFVELAEASCQRNGEIINAQ